LVGRRNEIFVDLPLFFFFDLPLFFSDFLSPIVSIFGNFPRIEQCLFDHLIEQVEEEDFLIYLEFPY